MLRLKLPDIYKCALCCWHSLLHALRLQRFSKGLLEDLVAGEPHLVRRLRRHIPRRRRPVPPVGQHSGADGPAGCLGVLRSRVALQKSAKVGMSAGM